MAKSPRRKRPFNQGDLVEATITSLERRGGSLARVGDAEVRVLGGVPGDSAQLRITHTGKHINVGQIQTLTEPSKYRVEAPCPVVTSCGGCPWQPASMSLQREVRATQVKELLAPLCDDATRHHGWIGPEYSLGYRTRALMVLRHRGGSMRMGFYAPGTQDLVPVDSCVIQHRRVNSVLKHAHHILARLDWPTWRSEERPGVIRGFLYRVDPGREEGILTLILSVKPGPKVAQAAQQLIRIEGVCGVHANINPKGSGPMLGERNVHLRGKRRQSVSYGDLNLQVGPTSFIQTRHDMAEAMVTTLGQWLPERMTHLVDLYAGAGVLGLASRARADRVTLIESHPLASEDSMRNIELLEASAVTAITEDAATAAPRVLAEGADAVILDPPRAGCAPAVIDAITALKGEVTVIYASCESRSLSRDLKRLIDAGFVITDVATFDMFPHTPHVEVGVALRRAAQ
ncbi:MAG: 23S rRNA (uracil(1939)-C(5))-methyltransferase RlmD [Myxococcota bacterium]